jgi:hypothetical protein
VIGYDDTYESSFFYPALTTVSLDLDLQGKEAVRRILDSGDGETSHTSILPARLVVRHSTGPKTEQGKTYRRLQNSCVRLPSTESLISDGRFAPLDFHP